MEAAALPRRAQLFAWGLTWLAYATYYLGRKGFGVVKQPLSEELGLSPSDLGAIDTAFLAAYTVGQFASGVLGDRWGARRLVGYGMLLSALTCAVFGLSRSAVVMTVVFAVNGLAQSSGWPGTTRAMAEWTTAGERGTVMGFWSTCYQVGGVVATLLAGELAERFGWRAAFAAAALGLGGVGLVVLASLPERRADEPARAVGQAASSAVQTSPAERRAAQLRVLKSSTLWLYGASYFFIKLIRYALLFWLPFYLSQTLGASTAESARISVAFDAGGIAGVILIGRLSDQFRRFSRAFVCVLWLFALVVVLASYVALAVEGVLGTVVVLALVGALLFGPDALLSGAAAQDAGGVHAPALSTGFVNGVGSAGALLQGLVVPTFAERYGWSALFPAFVALAACAAVALLPTLRRSETRH